MAWLSLPRYSMLLLACEEQHSVTQAEDSYSFSLTDTRGGRGGVLSKIYGREAQHKLEKWTRSDLTGFKKRGSIGLEIGKR